MSRVLCVGCKYYKEEGKATLDTCTHPINIRVNHRGEEIHKESMSRFCDNLNALLDCPLKEELENNDN